MSSAKLSLTIIGVALEVVGAFLTFWPEVAPRLSRAWAHVQRFTSMLAARIRQLLRRPKTVTGQASLGASIALSGRADVFQAVPHEGADPDTKFRFLLDQARRNQERLNEVEHRVAVLPGEWRKDVEATRAALEERIAQELEQQRELFIGRRLAGLGLIVTGSIVLGIVNLLH